ncbi:MAG: hypothetical protein M0Q47_04045 [Methanothrix sp.]|nr:hypothetical protein [Methanothrix sp.]MCK9405571.1 hypothetical protein [Methanothrix sp.]
MKGAESLRNAIEMTVELKVDGKEIPLSEFPQEIIGNTAAAMAQSLRGVDENWKVIEIRISQD